MTRAAAWAVRAAATLAALTLGPAVLTGCGASPAPLGPAGIDGLTIPTPSPSPADFAGHTENPLFPLRSGTRWLYRQYTPTGFRAVVATVLPEQRDIAGIPTTGVRWQVRVRGHERTALVRWYAVDTAGNVWWFGQQVRPHTPRLDSLAPSSWLAGRDGAEAGLVLTDPPRLGDGYLNALQPGVVERRSTVVSLTATVATTERTFRHTVATRDLSTLEPLHSVQSYYARGLGLVAQQDTVATSTGISLVRMRHG
ncbi:hypothetical protein [Nocardioides sp.]|jgi:hypothetical protein|uniref:hypothetical protein n=1 Tax=Nocardioides sp. TaxID=35761 RepID=UPI002F413E4A